MKETIRDGRRPGFFIIDNVIIDEYGKKIGAYGIAVYNLLARYANKDGENSFPSYLTIASKLGISRRTAIYSVENLVKVGLITKDTRRNEKGEPTSNLYTLSQVVCGAGNALGGAGNALGVVQVMHYGGAGNAPDLDLSYKDLNTNETTIAHNSKPKTLLTPNGDSPVADEIDTHLLNGKISPSMELVPSSETPSKIAPKVSPPAAAAKNPAYQECFNVFNDLKQEHEGVPGKKVIINGKETGQNINKWLAAGYTAEELATVFVALKQDGWRTNALNMATIVKEGANILRRKTGAKGKGLGLTGLQRWLQENYGVTDLETAALVAEKTEQELLDDHAFYA